LLRAERGSFDTATPKDKAEAAARVELAREINRTAGLTDISNLLWILAFYGVARYLDLLDALHYDDRIDW